MNRENEEVMPEAVYQLLIRLRTYETIFSLQSVCNNESPDVIGRFQFYKKFSYLEIRNYVGVVAGAQPDDYILAPKTWECLKQTEGYR